MIRRANKMDYPNIFEFVSKDCARNYFILMGLIKDPSTYQSIYIDEDTEIKALLFHRKSGNLQFVGYGNYDTEGFMALISTLNFGHLISPYTFTKSLEPVLKVYKKGAYIAECTPQGFNPLPVKSLATRLTLDNLNDVEALYKKVFSGYPKLAYMKRKLEEGRGIGYIVFSNNLLAVAQSEFGNVIVGVATDPDHQKGYATECLVPLLKDLLQSHPKVYLQYDNYEAGRIYGRLGFKPIDQVIHYQKR